MPAYISTPINIIKTIAVTTICNNYEYILKSIIFFSEFLRIHPFKDGNDRCARILFNIMTQHLIACPISLCSNIKLRSLYIEALKRADSLIKPNSLNNLIEYIYKRIISTYITFISTC